GRPAPEPGPPRGPPPEPPTPAPTGEPGLLQRARPSPFPKTPDELAQDARNILDPRIGAAELQATPFVFGTGPGAQRARAQVMARFQSGDTVDPFLGVRRLKQDVEAGRRTVDDVLPTMGRYLEEADSYGCQIRRPR